MAFSSQDIFGVMADEICRGKRHVVDAENSQVTADDGLHLVGRNAKWLDGWKSKRLGSHKHRERFLDKEKRERLRRGIEGFMRSYSQRSDGSDGLPPPERYYAKNRGYILEKAKSNWTDAEFRERKKAYRIAWIEAHPEEYRQQREKWKKTQKDKPNYKEMKRLENRRSCDRERIIRKFVKESLCDDCLVLFHTALSALNEKNKCTAIG